METSSDTALAERLRREDPEQFHTLVRMHLSFVLDLNTDDCDCASEKAKFRLPQKWSFVPFTRKGRGSSKGVMEGAPLTQEGICQVYQLIEFLSKEQNICQEGIFRRTGKLTRQQELKSLLNQGISLNLDDGLFSVHDCASVLKNFLAELPESLLTDAHYPAYCQIAEMCGTRTDCVDDLKRHNENRLQQALQLLLLLLPTENRILLKDILKLLHLTASHENSNKMSADSLATLFTPHLLCPRKLTPEAIHVNSQTMSGVVAFMIQKWTSLFNIPPKLATDIRAYCFERERRKLSPKKKFNESVSDSTAANTVFSFVDREQTALAHSTNPTEAALAQLYAHIQSLPESSKKKRLIKQFNKENGQGTPIETDITRKKHHRSKSLGDSIKKHIFNKGLKRQKNCTGEAYFNVSRSLSQEEINKPGSCIRLFQKNTEEDSFSLIQQDNIQGTFKSINSTNCVVQLSSSVLHDSKSQISLNSSENKDTASTESETCDTEEVLKNLASQISAKYHESKTNELCLGSIVGTRKRLSPSSNSETTCENNSSPKVRCLSEDRHLPSSPVLCTSDQSRPELSSRNQDTKTSSVSNACFFSPLPLVGNTNNRLTTPRNALTCFLTTSTPASQYRLRGPVDANHSNCVLTPIADENNSMSPITRSTQKMPKAMQETMMTPRCRKPVVLVSGSNLCHLANLDTLESRQKRHCVKPDGYSSSVEEEKDVINKDETASKSCEINLSTNHTSVLSEVSERSCEDDMDLRTSHEWSPSSNDISESGSLTSTFRSYLLNRSVLTASPVDLSFSSRTGDFDSSDDNTEEKIPESELLSRSLLYCLDGNQPSTPGAVEEQVSERPVDPEKRKSSVSSRAMEESAVANTKNTTLTNRTRTSTADLTAVPLLQAMLDQLRGELATVRVALDSERSAVRALKREKAAEIKTVREEEARKCRDAINDLKSRLERDHEDALQRQKDAITRNINVEMLRALKAKDSEVRQERNQAHAREETLKLQVRDAVRARSHQQPSANNIADIQKLQQEVSALRTQNKQLEERLQMVIDADRQKAADLRSQHEEHELQLTNIKKHSQQETHRLLEELKSKDRLISQLEKQLNLQTGRTEEQRERLLESLEIRKMNTMDRKTASSKSNIQRQSGEITESLTDQKEFPDAFYTCILKDHLKLLCEYPQLQPKMKREMTDRVQLEHELAASRRRIQELKKMLAEQRGGSAAMAERIASLQAETLELREQNELLEFRILELEECHENASVKIHSPDIRTDTESDSGIQSLPNSDDITSDTDLGIYDINIGKSLQNLPESLISSSDSSKLSSRIIAKVLPFTDLSIDTNSDADENNADGYNTLKKKLKNTECLQESGIFEEAEFNSQSTQTDDILELVEETGISEFKSVLDSGVVGELSAEIKKLNQFRALVEERGNCCDHKKLLCVDEGKGDDPHFSCASHIKELQYYKERLQILEDKILVYESNGETQARLLANRLQKEINLSAQVKDLTAKVQHLTNLNSHLEEEKCEFEEAENDTRLKCQKLEVKIIALNEKKSDLQAQLQQERRSLSRLRTSLSESERKRQGIKGQLNYIETVLNKYEHRNYELEERDVELRHRMELLETTIPVLVMWTVWRMAQDLKISHAVVNNTISNIFIKANNGRKILPPQENGSLYKYTPMSSPKSTTGVSDSICSSKQLQTSELMSSCSTVNELTKLKQLEEDQNRILSEKHEAEEKWKMKEKCLKERLEILESKIAQQAAELEHYKETEEKYKKRIQKLENKLYCKKQESSISSAKEILPATSDEITKTSIPSVSCGNLECMKKIEELVQSGRYMEERINELELKERAYMETLQQADELWSEMENSYKAHIAKAEDNEASLRDKVKRLEESETKRQHEDENYILMEKIHNLEQNEKELKERIHVLKIENNNLLKETTQLHDAIIMAQTELKKSKDLVEGPLKEELLKERKLSKLLQEEIKTLENEMQEASSAHEIEVNGLKAQLTKISRELVDMECTNSELKEEVETLESKVCELKLSLESQKTNEEKMMIQMSQTILEKEKELEATKQEIQYAKTPSAHDELKEALPQLEKQEIDTKSFPVRSENQKPCVKNCTCPDSQVTLIYVSGALVHKVHSPSFNRAFLQSLDLTSKVVVTVYALILESRA